MDTIQEVDLIPFSPIGCDFIFNINENHYSAYRERLNAIFTAFDVKLYENGKLKMLDDGTEAMTVWDKNSGAAFVVYDDTLPHSQQIVAIAHELGHFTLNHAQRFKGTQGTKYVIEHEAECVAYSLLRIISKLEGLMI